MTPTIHIAIFEGLYNELLPLLPNHTIELILTPIRIKITSLTLGYIGILAPSNNTIIFTKTPHHVNIDYNDPNLIEKLAHEINTAYT